MNPHFWIRPLTKPLALLFKNIDFSNPFFIFFSHTDSLFELGLLMVRSTAKRGFSPQTIHLTQIGNRHQAVFPLPFLTKNKVGVCS